MAAFVVFWRFLIRSNSEWRSFLSLILVLLMTLIAHDAQGGKRSSDVSHYIADEDANFTPVVNSDGSISPGETRARLNYFYYIRNKGYMENRGAFYLTFHLHVTRP